MGSASSRRKGGDRGGRVGRELQTREVEMNTQLNGLQGIHVPQSFILHFSHFLDYNIGII